MLIVCSNLFPKIFQFLILERIQKANWVRWKQFGYDWHFVGYTDVGDKCLRHYVLVTTWTYKWPFWPATIPFCWHKRWVTKYERCQKAQNSHINIKSVANFTVIDSFYSTYKINSVLSPRIDGLQSGCCFSNLILSRVWRRSVMNHCRPLMVSTAWLSRPENPSCSYSSQKAFYQILVDFLKKYDELSGQSHCPLCGLQTRRLTKRLFVEKFL